MNFKCCFTYQNRSPFVPLNLTGVINFAETGTDFSNGLR